MNELLNPREYEDLIKKLRHLRAQEQSTEKTLTELRIEKATLIKENIDRAAEGQKMGIYEAAGVQRQEVYKDLAVKEMLEHGWTSNHLPSHSVLQAVAAPSVPESVREQVLASPDMTVKAVRELIKEAKGASTPAAPKRPDWHTMLQRFREMDEGEQRVLADSINGDLARGMGKNFAKLGLLPTATRGQVKFAYQYFANLHHSDKGGDEALLLQYTQARDALYEHFDAE